MTSASNDDQSMLGSLQTAGAESMPISASAGTSRRSSSYRSAKASLVISATRLRVSFMPLNENPPGQGSLSQPDDLSSDGRPGYDADEIARQQSRVAREVTVRRFVAMSVALLALAVGGRVTPAQAAVSA